MIGLEMSLRRAGVAGGLPWTELGREFTLAAAVTGGIALVGTAWKTAFVPAAALMILLSAARAMRGRPGRR